MSKVISIQQAITELHPEATYHVAILTGAAECLVNQRELRTKYQTNRQIKYWSTYFLLKALTTSGQIKNWRSQRPLILGFLQMNENTFYNHLQALQTLNLVQVDEAYNIKLASYKAAAGILEITYTGLTIIPYNPLKNAGKQIFQYFLRAEEFKHQQQRQISGMMHHLGKNPLLRNDLQHYLMQAGADEKKLKEPRYFREQLLKLQIAAFRHGSANLDYIMTRRADVNRSNGAIQKNHSYISKRSASYLKMRMKKLHIIAIQKICVESKERSRLYVPGEDGKRTEAYKWNKKSQKTIWFLTDQITFNYEAKQKFERTEAEKKSRLIFLPSKAKCKNCPLQIWIL